MNERGTVISQQLRNVRNLLIGSNVIIFKFNYGVFGGAFSRKLHKRCVFA